MLCRLVLNNKLIRLESFCTRFTKNGQITISFRHSNAVITALHLHMCLYPLVEDCSDDKAGTTFQNYSLTFKNNPNKNWFFASEVTRRGDFCIILITNSNQIGTCEDNIEEHSTAILWSKAEISSSFILMCLCATAWLVVCLTGTANLNRHFDFRDWWYTLQTGYYSEIKPEIICFAFQITYKEIKLLKKKNKVFTCRFLHSFNTLKQLPLI